MATALGNACTTAPNEYRGITWSRRAGEWLASVYTPHHQIVNLGSRKSAVAAARLYDCGAIVLYGSEALTNFPLHIYQQRELVKVQRRLHLLGALDVGDHPFENRDQESRSPCLLEWDQNLMGPRSARGRVGDFGQGTPFRVVPPSSDNSEGGVDKENFVRGLTSRPKESSSLIFESKGGNFQQWIQRPVSAVGRHDKERSCIKSSATCHEGPSWRSPSSGPRRNWSLGSKDASRKYGARLLHHSPSESSQQRWTIKKPVRKARTRACRRVPPPVAAAPLGSTKWQYRGISWNQALGLWTAYLYDPENKKTVYLGTRKSQQEAAALHDWGMRILQGTDATTNFSKCSFPPSPQELAQVKDRLVAARSVTEKMACDRMQQILKECDAHMMDEPGNWCNDGFAESASRRTANRGTKPQGSAKCKQVANLPQSPPFLQSRCHLMPSHPASFGRHRMSPPLFGATEQDSESVVNRQSWPGHPVPDTINPLAPHVIGPRVATGVNLIDSGPLIGQYLIMVTVDCNGTILPVGYAPTAMQAAQVHDMVVLALHGANAELNFPASSYQLRSLGSVLSALPHLFPPPLFWKGISAAEDAGANNDLSFSGVHMINPCEPIEIMGRSPECDARNHAERCGGVLKGVDVEACQPDEDMELYGKGMQRRKSNSSMQEASSGGKTCVGKTWGQFDDVLFTSSPLPNRGSLEPRSPEDTCIRADSECESDASDSELMGSGLTAHEGPPSGEHSSDILSSGREIGHVNEEVLLAAETLCLLTTQNETAINDSTNNDGKEKISDLRNAGDECSPIADPRETEYHGVSLGQDGAVSASVRYKGRYWDLGRFDTPLAAARVHDEVALGLLGIRAHTNFDPGSYCQKNIQNLVRKFYGRNAGQVSGRIVEDAIKHAESAGVPEMALPKTSAPKSTTSSGVTRKGRVVRKPKRFQQGLLSIPNWGCIGDGMVSNLEHAGGKRAAKDSEFMDVPTLMFRPPLGAGAF
ncbi:hypothetical protein BSKO_00918 [Bryopsis sp. KO-2023]|nr:hypothetical protein BSKO_00918 [Bryopsis sp. KO-2023]